MWYICLRSLAILDFFPLVCCLGLHQPNLVAPSCFIVHLLQLKALSVLQKTGPIARVDPNSSSKGALSEGRKEFIRKRVLEGLAAPDGSGRPVCVGVQCNVLKVTNAYTV